MVRIKKPRALPLHKMIPNMITLTALAVGMTGIKFAISGKWEHAVVAILVAAVMDAFDGAAARLLKAQSKLGAELDSFSDFVSFGVAPAIVIYLWVLEDTGRWGWPVALIFAMSVALRLARFNVASHKIAQSENLPDNPLDKYFTGVPSPLGAMLALLPVIVSFQMEKSGTAVFRDPQLIGAWLIVVAAMMVSNIPTFSTKQVRIPLRMKIPALAVFVIILAGMINDTWPTLTIMCASYLLLLPFGVVHYRRAQRAFESGIIDHDGEDADIDDVE